MKLHRCDHVNVQRDAKGNLGEMTRCDNLTKKPVAVLLHGRERMFYLCAAHENRYEKAPKK